MQDYFYTIADTLSDLLQGREIFTCTFAGEESDFVRFNQSRVRQAGHVTQHSLTLDWIEDRRHASAEVTLAGELALDRLRLRKLVEQLREIRAQVPADPFLHYATEVHSSEQYQPNQLPAAMTMVECLLAAGKGHELVGIQASGAIHVGFANSLGQRNWMTSYSFNLDWSFYLPAARAVKARYAGFVWQDAVFDARVTAAITQLEALARPAHTIPPGRLRVYLTPMALAEIMALLGWGGFSLRAHRTGTTPLLHMVEADARLHPALTISDNNAEGIAPNFQTAGFIRPPRITLIDKGVYRDCLVSPRSAAEYGVADNGATDEEAPVALDVAAGNLADEQLLQTLDTGLYVGNLWYLNWSDRNAGRLTGMTRFATFWVKNGRIEGPVKVIRFDETIYHLLGDNLLALSAERELLLDPSSYGARSTRSARLPGALIAELNFTL